MPWQRVSEVLAKGIRDYFAGCGYEQAVLGLSGGVDSALTAKLAVEALGKRNVTALVMPETGVSSEGGIKQATDLAKELGIAHNNIEINDFLKPFEKVPWAQNHLAEMNTRARVRAVLLYNFANSNRALVLGTGNRSELMLGYFTKHGDEAADLYVLGDLYKTEVWELAKHLGLPGHFIEKKPSAELVRNQTDEADLGANYETLDQILKALLGEGRERDELVREGVDSALIYSIEERISKSEHKRRKPAVISSGLRA